MRGGHCLLWAWHSARPCEGHQDDRVRTLPARFLSGVACVLACCLLLRHSLPKGKALQVDLLPHQRVGLCREPGLDAGRKEPGVWGAKGGQMQAVRSGAPVRGPQHSSELTPSQLPVPLGTWGKHLRSCSRRTSGLGPRPVPCELLFPALRAEPFPPCR